MNYLEKFVNHLEEALLAFGISLASIILFVNVVLRYCFNSGWEWAEESVRYLIFWIVFLGGSVCARKGMHLSVDAVAVRISEEKQRLLRMSVNVICIMFCMFLVIYGIELLELAHMTGQVTPGLEMPILYVYLAIPLGGGLMAARFAQDFYRAFKRAQTVKATETS